MTLLDRRGPGTPGSENGLAPVAKPLRAWTAVAFLAASWLVPLAANTVHIDWVLPVLLLLGTASLLRTGHTLVDRLVISAGLLAGLLIAAGLVFTLWPWGLSPVPVSGASFSALCIAGMVRYRRSGRRPQIPTRVRGSDLIIMTAPVLTWILMRRPFAGKDFVASIPYTVRAHDAINHYTLFDTIHRIGGYQILKHGQAQPYVGEMLNYQPGAHYLYVLADVFRRSTTAPGASIGEYARYTQYEILGLCVLSLVLPWSARWIAGAAVAGWRRALICSTVAGLAVFGQLSTLFWNGFDPEVLGLALLALCVALIARPPQSPHEQVILAGALLTAVAFVYCLYLLNALFLVTAAYFAYRERVLRVVRLAIVTALATVGMSLIPLSGSLSMHPLGTLFTEEGWFVDFSRPLSVAFGVIAMAAVLTRTGRRSPAWRISSFTVATACGLAVAAELIGRTSTGTAMYYSSKLVDSAWVCSLVGFGALGLFLKDSPSRGRPALITDKRNVIRRPREETMVGALAVVLGLVFADGFPMSGHYETTGFQPQTTSVTVAWSRGDVASRWSAHLIDYASRAPLDDATPTVFAIATVPKYNRFLTTFSAALNHRVGTTDLDALEDFRTNKTTPEPDQAFAALNGLKLGATPAVLSAADTENVQLVESWIRSQPANLRVVVGNPFFATILDRFGRMNPDRRLSVVYLPMNDS